MTIPLEPIGTFICRQQFTYDSPRQGNLAKEAVGTVRLHPQMNFEQALADLEGFERIWLIYLFDRNSNWKPLIRPPRGNRKVGVFASRAPYRPNPIGMSCVRLLEIRQLDLHVAEHDLLDGTPILDIKPYLPYADSFPEAKAGWVDESEDQEFPVSFAPQAEEQLLWLETQAPLQLRPFLLQQLAWNPLDCKRKRLTQNQTGWSIAYRTWRADFSIDNLCIQIYSIRSAYSPEELQADNDPYGDKELHRRYCQRFPEN